MCGALAAVMPNMYLMPLMVWSSTATMILTASLHIRSTKSVVALSVIVLLEMSSIALVASTSASILVSGLRTFFVFIDRTEAIGFSLMDVKDLRWSEIAFLVTMLNVDIGEVQLTISCLTKNQAWRVSGYHVPRGMHFFQARCYTTGHD